MPEKSTPSKGAPLGNLQKIFWPNVAISSKAFRFFQIACHASLNFEHVGEQLIA